MKRVLAPLIVALGVLPSPSDAAIATFTDRTAFLAATGATSIGPLPSTVLGPFSLGGLAFTDHTGSQMVTGNNWSTLISEAFDLAVSGVESFNVASPGPLFAFGFDFHEPSTSTPPGPQFPDTCNTICVDSTFSVSLFAGAALVGSFNYNAADDALAFIGVASTVAFDRIEIRETSGTADNEFFGNFLIARQQLVPEPGTLALTGLAFAALGWARRRRH